MPTQKERIDRVARSRTAEMQKIELYAQDTEEISIDMRILKKISRKAKRNRR